VIVEQMSQETGITASAIDEIVRRASHMYRVYRIAKRSGNGLRTIEHPAPKLKTLQRWITVRLLSKLPVHEVVYSYREGRNIRDHAEVHQHGHFLLRIDLADFFPSISWRAVAALLSRYFPQLNAADVEVILRLVCRSKRLTIGAPSSPALSNAVLYPFDVAIAAQCAPKLITYTRYADDLYFSTTIANVLADVLPLVRAELAKIRGLELRVNEAKSTFTSPKRKRLVTGLVITPDKKISIGRHQKRKIRSLMHQFIQGQLPLGLISHLKGLVAFAQNVEPPFVSGLARKYGDASLLELRKVPSASRKA
jgi:RNA-directed DNA polymerase